ncbi:L,D-transpeptidase [Ancylobacter pratisalsi]|uniref:L,D-transpeptidase n=1 Tax=Ancylobacter pratisalsi TaxID=1745854 RepID=A0A6P1YHG5_9HYPH|nr:L,D-transpeptidase [Ancylobacter pratisalsi]QIB32410.1 L,D-transpeptidase [Ancylobacter pratisalsi]
MKTFDRRAVLGFSLAGAALALGGCQRTTTAGAPLEPISSVSSYASMGQVGTYGAVSDRFPIASFDTSSINPAYLRREVAYTTSQPPGTIVIDPREHYLYYVMPGGRAMRYGVGVGKEGFGWSGTATINSKQEWPDWYPPAEMIARRPDIKPQLSKLQSGIGVAGGLSNPLGARAMYLWQNGKDTLYRIHGTLEPTTIGTNVSSGCIRMINQDAIDLYNRVTVGTKVVVLGASAGV